MIRRPVALAVVAASLLAATFVASPAAVAAPGDPNQVALFVQYPDGSSRSSCVDYRSGMRGSDVLAAAGPSYGTGPYAGFVLEIGGQGTVPPTDSTYWAYWRGTSGGSYSYSGAGVTSTRPTAGSVEAWIWYQNGAAGFPHRTYASLCPSGFAATPPPNTPPPNTAPPNTAAPAAPAPTSAGVAAPPRSGGGATQGSGSGRASTGTGSASAAAGTTPASGSTAPSTATPAASSTATSTASTGAPGSTGSTGAGTSVAASDVAVTDDAGGLGVGSTVGLLAVAVAVVGFAVLAAVARRRRLDED